MTCEHCRHPSIIPMLREKKFVVTPFTCHQPGRVPTLARPHVYRIIGERSCLRPIRSLRFPQSSVCEATPCTRLQARTARSIRLNVNQTEVGLLTSRCPPWPTEKHTGVRVRGTLDDIVGKIRRHRAHYRTSSGYWCCCRQLECRGGLRHIE